MNTKLIYFNDSSIPMIPDKLINLKFFTLYQVSDKKPVFITENNKLVGNSKQGNGHESHSHLYSFEEAVKLTKTWNSTEETKLGIGFVFSKEHNIIAIDIDDENWKNKPSILNLISEINSYTEYSPSGKLHIFVEVDDKNKLPGKKVFKNFNIEIFSSSNYITITGKCYNGYNKIRFISVEELNNIFKKYLSEGIIKEPKFISVNSDAEVQDGDNLITNEDKIIDILSKYYEPSNRQNLCLYLAGFLRKAGLDAEQATKVISRLVEHNNNQEDLPERLAVIQYTYDKDIAYIAGSSKLKEMLNEEDFLSLASCFKRQMFLYYFSDCFEVDGRFFFIKKDFFYERRVTKTGDIREEPIGPAFEIKEYYFDKERQRRIFKLILPDSANNDEIIVEEIDDIPKKAGLVIQNKKLYGMIFSHLRKYAPKKVILTQPGWDENFKKFYIPSIDDDKISWRLSLIEKFIIKNKEEQHKFVLEALTEGKILGFLFLASVSSLFIGLNGCDAFSILVCGPSGIGKTTGSMLASQIFYDNNNLFSCNSTNVGIDLLFKNFRNLPLLLDELSDSTINLESLIFSIFRRTCRIRGTKNLDISHRSSGSVAFFTSNADVTSQMTNQNPVKRRMLKIVLKSSKDLTDIPMDTLIYNTTEMIGCGVDYINYLNDNLNNLIIDRKNDFVNPIMAGIEQILNYGLNLLENYYSCKFDNLRMKLEEILLEQKNWIEETVDPVEHFIDKLSDFIAFNSSKIYYISRELPDDRPIKDFWFIEDENYLYVTPSVLKKFCADNHIVFSVIADDLRKKKILAVNKSLKAGKFTIPKRVGDFVIKVHKFVKSELRKYKANSDDIDYENENDNVKCVLEDVFDLEDVC